MEPSAECTFSGGGEDGGLAWEQTGGGNRIAQSRLQLHRASPKNAHIPGWTILGRVERTDLYISVATNLSQKSTDGSAESLKDRVPLSIRSASSGGNSSNRQKSAGSSFGPIIL